MIGQLRFYDNFWYGLMRGRFTAQTDVLKIALLGSGYAPCTSYGTRDGLLNYSEGDVIFSAAHNCFFVASQGGKSALGAPIFDTAAGNKTTDGTVVWVSVGLAPPSTHVAFADVSANEVAAAGYTAGGIQLAHTNTIIGRKTSLGAPVAVWAGSTITARYAVIYKFGTVDSVTDPLLGYVLLDTTGVDVSSQSGDFRVRFGNEIIYTLGGW